MMGRSLHRLYISSDSVLLSTTFTSVFLLFFTSFSTPYLDFVYFVKANFNTEIGIITLGAFGFCSDSGGLKNCSPGSTGYQFDDVPLIEPFSIPPISKALTRALVLHVVAFVLSLVTTTIIICKALHIHGNLLGRYAVHLVVLLAVFTYASFVTDLLFLHAAEKAFGPTTTVKAGNGIWLTSISLVLLLLGLLYCGHQRLEAKSRSRGKWVSPSSDKSALVPDLEASTKDKEQDESNIQDRLASSPLFTVPPMKSQTIAYAKDCTVKADGPTATIQSAQSPAASSPHEGLTILTPLRRVPSIFITDTCSESLHSSSVSEPTQEYPSTRSSLTGYAPSAYSTFCSDATSTMVFTPGLLSRSSTSASRTSTQRHPARRSTLNPHTIEQWLNSDPLTGRSAGRSDRKPLQVNSVSTLGSVIHQFPRIPSPQPVHFPFALQFRDRFIEHHGGSIALDARSFVSAVPSSDIELDVQTIAPSSPKRLPMPEVPDLPTRHDLA